MSGKGGRDIAVIPASMLCDKLGYWQAFYAVHVLRRKRCTCAACMPSFTDNTCSGHPQLPEANSRLIQSTMPLPYRAEAALVLCSLPVDINIEVVMRNVGLLGACRPYLNRQPCAHLGPDKRHFSAQPKLATSLLHAVLRPRQDTSKQIGNVLVPHASTIILQNHQCIKLGESPAAFPHAV